MVQPGEPDRAPEPEEPDRAPEPEERLNQITAAAFFSADHVVEAGGKLYTNGGFFSTLRFATYPGVLPTLGIAASLIVPWHAYQEDHQFIVTLHDEDGRELPLRVEGTFRVGADILLRHGDPSTINLAGNVTNVVFERPGHYHLRLQVNNEKLARWDLQVVQLPLGFPSAAMPGLP
jgi:hypothetical protein